jgi:VIT1/CCC1 family predicted Fe2+/Mn2+ transporter
MILRDPIAHIEIYGGTSGARLNWLRAAVLGANDGIVSVSSVILGVSGASNSKTFVLTAGIAAIVAGALSMAVGEYVSVSTQRDTEKILLEKGHIKSVDHLANPFHAAYASGLAFLVGAIIPLLAVIFSPDSSRDIATFISVVMALVITGMLSAYAGGANKLRATVRVVFGGVLAMAITFLIGRIFGVSGVI